MNLVDIASGSARLSALTLPSTGLDIWWVPLPEIEYDLLQADYVGCLSREELHRLQSRRLPKGQFQFLFTRVVLRHLLSAYHPSIAPADWLVDRSESGRPHLSKAQTPLSFNLTHTSDCLVFAFSQYANPGIDIELLSRTTEYEGIAKRYFSAQEYGDLLQLPEAERVVLFFRLWTLKEAAVKASGLGLARGLRRFRFRQQNGELLSCVYDVADSGEMVRRFQFWSTCFRNYVVAAALVSETGKNIPDIQPVSRSIQWPDSVSMISPDWIYGQSRNSSTNLEP
jgi:4'-phosphopantetheinyl transferase